MTSADIVDKSKSTKTEVEEDLQKTFSMYDNDNDGQITFLELGHVMKKLGYSLKENELKKMIDSVDNKGNGMVDFTDFKRIMQNQLEQISTDDEFLQAFKLFDKNSDGKISFDELQETMLSLGEDLTAQEVHDMILEADQTGDGFINFEEFKQMMTVDDNW